MRHGKKFNHLSRKKGHRDAMLANMASSLIIHKRIFTTTAKAKALRVFVEPLITKAKTNITNNRRVVFSYLRDKHAVTELFNEVAAKVANRPGGYTRIFKTHNRLGDNADMCMMELVDFNDLMLDNSSKVEKSAGKKRSRRSKGKGKTTEAVVEKVEEVANDAASEAKDEA